MAKIETAVLMDIDNTPKRSQDNKEEREKKRSKSEESQRPVKEKNSEEKKRRCRRIK